MEKTNNHTFLLIKYQSFIETKKIPKCHSWFAILALFARYILFKHPLQTWNELSVPWMNLLKLIKSINISKLINWHTTLLTFQFTHLQKANMFKYTKPKKLGPAMLTWCLVQPTMETWPSTLMKNYIIERESNMLHSNWEHPLDLRWLRSRWGNLLSSKVLDNTRVLVNKIPFWVRRLGIN
jgi:hypothetical protein